MKLVLDASAMLAALLEEPGGELVYELLDDCLISTVNVAEIASALARNGQSPENVRQIVESLKLASVPPDERMAVDAGLLREITDPAGLSLGDRFCLALARRISAPVLTSDRAWLKIADMIDVQVRTIR